MILTYQEAGYVTKMVLIQQESSCKPTEGVPTVRLSHWDCREPSLFPRGAYCALAVATVTNIMTPELYENTAEWLASCQTYEGGFSAVPGTEAHGGYTFCGFAAALLLNKHHLCDIPSLLVCEIHRKELP